MPYDFLIDHDLRLVISTVHGDVTEADVFAYSNDPIWSRQELRGYSEMIDVTQARKITFHLVATLPLFADRSARRDLPGELAGNLLIVAADDLYFGLGRMYQTLRELHPLTQRKVGVFRTRQDALAWLAKAGHSADLASDLREGK
jgi:hypothetical protein